MSGDISTTVNHVATTGATTNLEAARQYGWDLAKLVVKSIEAGDQTNFPGIKSWLDDYHAIAKNIESGESGTLPPLDVEKLVTNNANFCALTMKSRRATLA